MTKEDDVSEALVDSLKQRNQNSRIEIGHKKEILIGSTCGYYKQDLRLLFQTAEQDVVVYLKDNDEQRPKYVFEGGDFFEKFPKSLTDDRILIPLVIFEAKYKNVNTHTIRQYSELARMIKTIFPFCLYNLLLININMPRRKDADRTYMASKSFDRVIYKSGYDVGNHIHNKLVDTMWKIVQDHVEYLKDEEYFRLTTFL